MTKTHADEDDLRHPNQRLGKPFTEDNTRPKQSGRRGGKHSGRRDERARGDKETRRDNDDETNTRRGQIDETADTQGTRRRGVPYWKSRWIWR